ncbi:hypothetical protein CYMTET_4525 [Cymbomonas tetramitiformis]|uniref:Uncharacterized protein n=1 Tax=Cymbomonas tetramitiformis TaxID=36881 RepID=A0AAE0LJS4_9CHLO|nr:hypothetical protein CYMTET_4525 [Cymbomonas tetramitiformis]
MAAKPLKVSHTSESSEWTNAPIQSLETVAAEHRDEMHKQIQNENEQNENEQNENDEDSDSGYDTGSEGENVESNADDPHRIVETKESVEVAKQFFELGTQIAKMSKDIYDVHTKVNESGANIASLLKEFEIDKKERAECSAELRQQQETMDRLLEALKKSSSEDGQMKIDLATTSDQLELCKSKIDGLKDRKKQCMKTKRQKRVRFAELNKQHKDRATEIGRLKRDLQLCEQRRRESQRLWQTLVQRPGHSPYSPRLILI